ncbi:LOB domain-containing protein 19-like isoform X2 [Mangifera indica]|uniref:LOB domain-containing protein 19-like isoform X2 n=1 Tax=Mangifera indica TaxID=29780 RepID=UPI001CFAD106|nr:LOB domain-containing protein 19-like isoform X2 [Mangifera indica]
MNTSNGGGPCGACKFLRRKCVKGCIFAPYFDSDQGTAHFAAVHKVFGASNASKLLMRLPVHKRLEAVITLCYEALARVRDPVYGSVGHIFTLQQQAELAYTQARLSILQRLPFPLPAQPQTASPTSLNSSSEIASSMDLMPTYNISMHFDPLQPRQSFTDFATSCCPLDQELDNGELQALAWEFIAKYFPGVRFRSSSSD